MTSLYLAASPMACLLCYVLGKRRGMRRGRELEAMRPPYWGDIHFRDGPIWPVYADSCEQAVERVAQLNGRDW